MLLQAHLLALALFSVEQIATVPADAAAPPDAVGAPPPPPLPAYCGGRKGCKPPYHPPGTYHSANQSLSPTRFVNVKTDFNATGDGNTDDWVNIAAAIQHAKAARPAQGLYFPPGHYRVTQPLDFGAWNAMLVVGGGIPGGAGIANENSVTRISADIVGNQTGACFDFSGSGYGRVSGIAFECTNAQLCALNARTAGIGPQDNFHPDWTIYGSDIVYESCNFHGGTVAVFANHMGEVLTWRDCKFNGPNNVLITWRLGDAPWNIRPMHGRAFTTGVTLTMFRMYGGELTGSVRACCKPSLRSSFHRGTAVGPRIDLHLM